MRKTIIITAILAGLCFVGAYMPSPGNCAGWGPPPNGDGQFQHRGPGGPPHWGNQRGPGEHGGPFPHRGGPDGQYRRPGPPDWQGQGNHFGRPGPQGRPDGHWRGNNGRPPRPDNWGGDDRRYRHRDGDDRYDRHDGDRRYRRHRDDDDYRPHRGDRPRPPRGGDDGQWWPGKYPGGNGQYRPDRNGW